MSSLRKSKRESMDPDSMAGFSKILLFDDGFEKEDIRKRALVLDRIMDDQIPASQSRLLRLPTDILADIVDMLSGDRQALASLASVNGVCRQLARSSQFATVRFDYSDIRRQVVKKLAKELDPPVDTRQKPLTIGACIRRFIMAPNLNNVKSADGTRSLYLPSNDPKELRENGNREYRYWRSIVQEIITYAMPNLEVLNWRDTFHINEEFLRDVMLSPARRIKLKPISISSAAAAAFAQRPSESLTSSLRSLELDMHIAKQSSENISQSELEETSGRFYDALLRCCASTIQSLAWTQTFDWGDTPTTVSFSNELIKFPHLRTLRFNTAMLPSSVFLSFLNAPLRHLELPVSCNWDELAKALANCNTIPNLETLFVQSFPRSEEHAQDITAFIARNSNMQTLEINHELREKGDSVQLDSFIIPLLSTTQFENLKSLSLRWGRTTKEEPSASRTVEVPYKLFSAVGSLTTLEQLSLGTGALFYDDCPWLIDHDKAREAFSGLRKLRQLVFTQEDDIDTSDLEPYMLGDLEDEESEMSEDDEVWLSEPEDPVPEDGPLQRARRDQAIRQADQYAAMLPALERMYIGHMFLRIRESPTELGWRVAAQVDRFDIPHQDLPPITFARATLEYSMYNP
ncbi:hypothetical protein F4804DRAFT_322864 [Jackrogersella minutella]|nr:hypothetical protein F4804DRAFT_322864 [Jackrogersella minutella]